MGWVANWMVLGRHDCAGACVCICLVCLYICVCVCIGVGVCRVYVYVRVCRSVSVLECMYALGELSVMMVTTGCREVIKYSTPFKVSYNLQFSYAVIFQSKVKPYI